MSDPIEQLIQDDWVCERATVDAKNPDVLHGVRLLAAETQRGKRKYPEPLRRAMIPVFERLNVYLNHPDITRKDRPLNAPRLYEERVGWVVEGTVSDDGNGLIGDVELNPEHAQAKSIKHDFNRKTPRVGISYRGKANFGNLEMTGICERIQEVWGLDIVDNPGSGGSLRESMESYDQGKEHGELRAKVDAHEKTLAEHSRMHELHERRFVEHGEMHANHEGRMTALETSMAKCNEQYQAMGGEEHVKTVEQWREEIDDAKRLTAESRKISEQAAAAIVKAEATSKIIPRTPNAGNPFETRTTAAPPVTNGVGLKAPNFHKN